MRWLWLSENYRPSRFSLPSHSRRATPPIIAGRPRPRLGSAQYARFGCQQGIRLNQPIEFARASVRARSSIDKPVANGRADGEGVATFRAKRAAVPDLTEIVLIVTAEVSKP